MSAIAGIYNLDGRSVNRDDVARMVDVLAHRGPDGAQVWCEGAVGFGHRMLHTTPESLHEVLPLVDTTRDLVITADARIDNRDDLIEALGLATNKLDELSDSQLILAAYVKWGEECAQHLLGDFIFVIWDGRRQKLFCARDHFGVKGLYYYHAPGKFFAFATEIKALLCLPDVPRRLNELRVGVYLTQVSVSPTETFYQDIFSLSARHTLVIANGQKRLSCYWTLEMPRELKLKSDDEYAEAFRAVFNQAVDCRLRSAFPIGSTLSGGLDSSAIACTARDRLRAAGRPELHTFSAIFPDVPEPYLKQIDEREYIEEVVRVGGIKAHYARPDLSSPLADLDRVFFHLDEPPWAPNLYIHWLMFEAAQTAGVRVLLEGSDGDTTVSHGTDYFMELVYRGKIPTLIRAAKTFSRQNTAWGSTRGVIWRLGLKPVIEHMTPKFIQRTGKRRAEAWDNSLINPHFAERIGLWEYLEANTKCTPVARSVRATHRADLLLSQWASLLETVDKSAAAFGLEMRYPFFDRRLAEFCVSLPTDQKIRQGWTRFILRRAMSGVMPDKICWRTNKGNLSHNFQRMKECDQEIIQALSGPLSSETTEFLGQEKLDEAYRIYQERPLEKRSSLHIYEASVLNRWLDKTQASAAVAKNTLTNS